MTDTGALSIGQNMIWTSLLVGGPIVLVALAVGLAVSVFQAATQVSELTLTFVPKVIAIVAVLALLGPWMLTTLVDYAVVIFASLPEMAR